MESQNQTLAMSIQTGQDFKQKEKIEFNFNESYIKKKMPWAAKAITSKTILVSDLTVL